MSKLKTIFVCQSCGYTSTNWVGQCPQCQEWNSFMEDVVSPSLNRGKQNIPGSSRMKSTTRSKTVSLSSVSIKPPKRLSTNISEFDRVLGGGFVPGQVVLLSGEPGIGKSTLLTEICRELKDNPILYICGEENIEQIKLRVSRLNYKGDNLSLLPETSIEMIDTAVRESFSDERPKNKRYSLLIIDSIQTLYSNDLGGLPGSLVQVRGCTQLLTNMAKELDIPVVLVGHVTKEGVVAGPKVLEHIVDTVLFLEGDSQHMFRILKTTKNRFGPVSEVGIFEMFSDGIKEVKNPSQVFLEQRMEKSPGSCVGVTMEGYRPILFEVQALTTKTSFGYPKRTASGFNVNRLQVLLAILEKRVGLPTGSYDVYINIAGGFKVNEYASDLAVCLAVVSALKDIPIKSKTAVFGECGLSGEIRKVVHQEKRQKEASRLGFTNVIGYDRCKSILSAIKQAF